MRSIDKIERGVQNKDSSTLLTTVGERVDVPYQLLLSVIGQIEKSLNKDAISDEKLSQATGTARSH